MNIIMIAALGLNYGIGYRNKLPWSLPVDLQYFKENTVGHTVVMGRKCYDSIGKPLPNRTNIILTKQKGYRADGCLVYNSIDDFILQYDPPTENIFIIGGEQIYREFIDIADYLYITKIHHTFKADTYFPKFSIEDWELIFSVDGKVDSKNKYMHTFMIYQRRSKD